MRRVVRRLGYAAVEVIGLFVFASTLPFWASVVFMRRWESGRKRHATETERD